jgi:transcriptional regulator with XRE-family HTH domain
MEIGVALKRIRSALGINQSELSELTGMSVSMISAIEQGQRNPSEEMVEKLLEVLKLNRTQLELISLGDPEEFDGRYRELAEFTQNRVLNSIRAQHEARKWLLAH